MGVLNREKGVKSISSNGLSLKEYLIGELLYNHHLSGFIQYICIFKCYDDTAKRAPKITQIQPSKPYNIPIKCSPELRSYPHPTDAFRVLNALHISSYMMQNLQIKTLKSYCFLCHITEGSLENYHWTNSNIAIYKNLIIHIFLSLATAYINIKLIRWGFTFR